MRREVEEAATLYIPFDVEGGGGGGRIADVCPIGDKVAAKASIRSTRSSQSDSDCLSIFSIASSTFFSTILITASRLGLIFYIRVL
jgi:hypothetical protein